VYSSGFDRHLPVFCNEFGGCGISILGIGRHAGTSHAGPLKFGVTD